MMLLIIGRPAPFRVQIIIVGRQTERPVRVVVVGRVRVVDEQTDVISKLRPVAKGQTFERREPGRLELIDIALRRIRPY